MADRVPAVYPSNRRRRAANARPPARRPSHAAPRRPRLQPRLGRSRRRAQHGKRQMRSSRTVAGDSWSARVSAARGNVNLAPGVAGENPRGPLPSLSEAGGKPSVLLPAGCCGSATEPSRPYAVIRCIRHWVRLRLSRARAVAGGRERGWSCQGSTAGPMSPTSPRTRRGPKARRRPQGGALSSPTPPPAGSARWRTGSQSSVLARAAPDPGARRDGDSHAPDAAATRRPHMAERYPGRYARPPDPPPRVDGPGEHPARWVGDIYPAGTGTSGRTTAASAPARPTRPGTAPRPQPRSWPTLGSAVSGPP